MTTMAAPMCYYCRRFHADHFGCEAFPQGVPDLIMFGDADHRKPFPGDNGLRFALVPGKKLPDYLF